MRGLGWLNIGLSDGFDTTWFEVLNDRRLIHNLACGTSGFTKPGTEDQMCWVYGQRWFGCDGGWDEIDFDADPDPWAGVRHAAEFYGYFVEQIDGFPTDFERTVNQRGWAFGGANFTALRARHLSLTFTVLLAGASERGLNVGLNHLRNLLRGTGVCARYEAAMFDECPDEPSEDDTGYTEPQPWSIHDATVLDPPKWLEEPVEQLGCTLRRVQFTLGAEDGHLYRCPVVCTARTAFEVPEPANETCYTWSEYFCNTTAEPISCSIAGTSGIAGATKAAVIEIFATADGAPPMTIIIDPTLGPTREFRTMEIPPNSTLTVDGARRRVTLTTAAGTVDGSSYIDVTTGVGVVWAEAEWWDLFNGPTLVAVRPFRLCNLEFVEAQISIVERLG